MKLAKMTERNEGSYEAFPSASPEPHDCTFPWKVGVVIAAYREDTNPLQQMEPTNSFYQIFKKVHKTRADLNG